MGNILLNDEEYQFALMRLGLENFKELIEPEHEIIIRQEANGYFTNDQFRSEISFKGVWIGHIKTGYKVKYPNISIASPRRFTEWPIDNFEYRYCATINEVAMHEYHRQMTVITGDPQKSFVYSLPQEYSGDLKIVSWISPEWYFVTKMPTMFVTDYEFIFNNHHSLNELEVRATYRAMYGAGPVTFDAVRRDEVKCTVDSPSLFHRIKSTLRKLKSGN